MLSSGEDKPGSEALRQSPGLAGSSSCGFHLWAVWGLVWAKASLKSSPVWLEKCFHSNRDQCRSAQIDPEGEEGRAQMWTRGSSYSRMRLQPSPKLLNASTPNKHSSDTNVVHVTSRARNAAARVHRPGSNPTPTSSTAPNLLALTDADSTCFESGTEETPQI